MEDFTPRDVARMSSKVAELRVEDLFRSQDDDETSDMDSPSSENKATEWTNEKHVLYLKSMEVSFMRHYYDILRLRSSSSDRFKTAHGGGSWQTINFDKGRSLPKRTEHSGSLISNPWIRRLRPARRGQAMSSSSSDAMDTDQEVDSREMSDQNFVGEIIEVSSESDDHNSKKLRIDLACSASTSSGDQMVPFGWLPSMENANDCRKTRKE